LIPVIAGMGLLTGKSNDGDVPPPGGGFTTVSFPIIPVVNLLAPRVAFKAVAELYCVAKGVPSHWTDELGMNPVPVIVTGVSVEPAPIEDGFTVMMAGMGFETGGGFVGAVAAPPHPAITHIKYRKQGKRAHLVRFIVNSRYEINRVVPSPAATQSIIQICVYCASNFETST
jgi:hypothetical protein